MVRRLFACVVSRIPRAWRTPFSFPVHRMDRKEMGRGSVGGDHRWKCPKLLKGGGFEESRSRWLLCNEVCDEVRAKGGARGIQECWKILGLQWQKNSQRTPEAAQCGSCHTRPELWGCSK